MARDEGRIFPSGRSSGEREALESFNAALNGGARPSHRQERTSAFDAELPEVGPRLRRVIEASAVPATPVAPVVIPVAPVAPRLPVEPSGPFFSRFALPGCAALVLAGTLATGAVAYSIASFPDSSSTETNGWYRPSPEPEPLPEPELAPELPATVTPGGAPSIAPEVAPASAEVIELTDGNFDSFVENAKGPVIVDFYATWCGPCKVLSPKLDLAAAQYAGKITIVRVDVDKSKTTSDKYNITGMPTLVAIEGGKELKRIDGLPSDAELKAFIGALIK